MVTGRTVLEALKEIERTSPQKLDEPLYATYGNDENGNADIIPIQALLNGNEESVNGIPTDSDSPVIVLDDEGNNNFQIICVNLPIFTLELLEELLNITVFVSDRLMPEEYDRFKEISKLTSELRQNMNAL